MVDLRPVGPPQPKLGLGLPARLGLLCALIVAEKIGLSALVDVERARNAQGLGALVHGAQHWGFRYLVTFLAAASLLAFVRGQQLPPSSAASRLPDIRYGWILLHVLLVIALAGLSYALFRVDFTQVSFALMVAAWVCVCATALLAAALGLISSSIWLREIRSFGIGWAYAATAALLGINAWLASERFWQFATVTTFTLVKWVLRPIVPMLTVNTQTHVLAGRNFAVEITQTCSGLEGLGLTLAFSSMWLLYFRREYIFPRALILIPVSLVAIFGLNVFRIAALLLIGDAGFPDVASYGFHSQAGWIIFNAVACALVFFSRRSKWLCRSAPTHAAANEVHNPTAMYLVPLLAILAAGTISHALSGGFETLDFIRLIAAIAAIGVFYRGLLTLHWHFSWRGPAVGVSVFVLWVCVARTLLPELTAPERLTAMLPLQQALWITSHCLTSIVFVPLAEELAYRGYLMRRLTALDFESVSYRSVRWPALVISAIAFGAAHRTLWLPGILAGAAYGWLAIRRGSLSDAVFAHATTNGLIAVAVLAAGQWQLW